jgi:hypothetical protein
VKEPETIVGEILELPEFREEFLGNHPTAEWIAQQITEAFPWNEAPCYLNEPETVILKMQLAVPDLDVRRNNRSF